jgi:hypothetical protein
MSAKNIQSYKPCSDVKIIKCILNIDAIEPTLQTQFDL